MATIIITTMIMFMIMGASMIMTTMRVVEAQTLFATDSTYWLNVSFPTVLLILVVSVVASLLFLN